MVSASFGIAVWIGATSVVVVRTGALPKWFGQAGLVIATADLLFESGNFKHAAEFLKANLRKGIVVRPWVYEALAIALEKAMHPDVI